MGPLQGALSNVQIPFFSWILGAKLIPYHYLTVSETAPRYTDVTIPTATNSEGSIPGTVDGVCCEAAVHLKNSTTA